MTKRTMTKEETDAIKVIVDRAIGLAAGSGAPMDNDEARQLTMDIIFCHTKSVPLKLVELSRADNFNLVHDVFGIRRHMNRKTCQLEDCFMPRYSA